MPYYLCPSCARILKTNRCDFCRPASVYALPEMDHLRRQRDELAEALHSVVGSVTIHGARHVASSALANLEADDDSR